MKNGKKSKSNLKISCFFKSRKAGKALKGKKNLLKEIAADALSGAEGKRLEVAIVFTGTPEIKKLNSLYFSRDGTTDVITLNYPELPAPAGEYAACGDVFICFDQAEKQAAELGHGILEEAAFLTVHGCLHLLGHEDNSAREKAAMNKAAEKILKKFRKRIRNRPARFRKRGKT